MKTDEIAKLPLPELNKKCKEYGVDVTLPLTKRREALAEAIQAAGKPAKKAKPEADKPAKAKPSKPEPEVKDDEDDAEEAPPPKKKAKEAPVAPANGDIIMSTLARIEAQLTTIARTVNALDQRSQVSEFKFANTFGVVFKNFHELAAAIGVESPLSDFGSTMAGYGEIRNGKPSKPKAVEPAVETEEPEVEETEEKPKKKGKKKPEPEPEVEEDEEEEIELEDEEDDSDTEGDDSDDEDSEIPEAARPYIKMTKDGPELKLNLSDVDEMDEAACRALLEVIGESHDQFGKGKIRALRGHLKEALQAASGASEDDEDEEAEEEVPAKPAKKGKKAKFAIGDAVSYTDDEGDEYEGTIEDPDDHEDEEVGPGQYLVSFGESYMVIDEKSLKKA